MLALLGLLLVGGAALVAGASKTTATSNGPTTRPGAGPRVTNGAPPDELVWLEQRSARVKVSGYVRSSGAPYVGTKPTSRALRWDAFKIPSPGPGTYRLELNAKVDQRGACVRTTVAWEAVIDDAGQLVVPARGDVLTDDRECGTVRWGSFWHGLSSTAVQEQEIAWSHPLAPSWRLDGGKLIPSLILLRQSAGGEVDPSQSRPVDSVAVIEVGVEVRRLK